MVMKQLIGTLLLALVLGGCGSEPAARPGGDAQSVSHDGVWKLQSGTGPQGDVPIVVGWDISLEIADGMASGRAACNSYGGSVSISGSSFRARGFSMTEMGCSPEVSRSQDSYIDAFQTVDTIARDGETFERR